MKKFEKTFEEYSKLQKQIVEECKEYLTEVAKAWNGKYFPLSYINREFDCDEAHCCIIYDGGNHPEYASNACSEVESLYMKGKEPVLSIEDSDSYAFNRVENEDIITLAFAVYAAVDYTLDSFISLIGGEGTIENGRWTITRGTWNTMLDIANGKVKLSHFDIDENEDDEEIFNCYNAKAFVTLIKRVAKIGEDKVTWEWE